MSEDEIFGLAKAHGYEAVCMRASLAGVASPPERIGELRRKLDAAGLQVSMVTGDIDVPSNNDRAPELLRRITPYLDLAEALGADLIRVAMKREEDIGWAQRAADEARERSIRLAHQSHCASLFETVEGSLRVLQAVGRPNFGLIYEPANWMIAGEPYGRSALERFAPYLFNVYVQNHRLTAAGKAAVETWKRGRIPLEHIGLWEPGGVDFREVFAGLRAVGYRGFITVHQAFAGVMPVEEAVRRSARFLRRAMEAA